MHDPNDCFQTVNHLDLEGDTLRKDNKAEKQKNEKLLVKYKILEDEFDLLKIEHQRILDHCKLLEQMNSIQGNHESIDCT